MPSNFRKRQQMLSSQASVAKKCRKLTDMFSAAAARSSVASETESESDDDDSRPTAQARPHNDQTTSTDLREHTSSSQPSPTDSTTATATASTFIESESDDDSRPTAQARPQNDQSQTTSTDLREHTSSSQPSPTDSTTAESIASTFTESESGGDDSEHTESPSSQPSATDPAAATPSTFIDDIGKVITSTMSHTEVNDAVNNLSDTQKLHLIESHFKPNSTFVFPSEYINRCNRSCNMKWLNKYPWLVYSRSLDGVFCLNCALFVGDRANKRALVNGPFTKWTRCSKAFMEHANCSYHFDAAKKSDIFMKTTTNPNLTLPSMFDATRSQVLEQNREIMLCVTEAIKFCGKQCIALRGHNEDDKKRDDQNKGNFISILKLMNRSNTTLRNHLADPDKKNATYLSPNIQNQIIQIIGEDIILPNVVNEVKDAQYYSVMADEVTTHNQEQLSLCVRFVDADNNIREEFLGFVHVIRTTGEVIANTILKTLKDVGLPIDRLRGQGYDRASAMSSDRVGVQARIRQEVPRAIYTHCNSHCLNLVLVHSCALPIVRNVIDKLKETCLFFGASPKRNALLSNIISVSLNEPTKRKPLLDLCKTRWTERAEAYRHFYQAYCYTVQCLEVIAHGLHGDAGFEPTLSVNGNWDRDSKARALSALNALCDFSFIVTFLTVYKILSRLE